MKTNYLELFIKGTEKTLTITEQIVAQLKKGVAPSTLAGDYRLLAKLYDEMATLLEAAKGIRHTDDMTPKQG